MALVAQPLAQNRLIAVNDFTFSGEDIPCPLCASADHVTVADTDRHGNPLKIVLCQACGHVFTNPQPVQSELDAFYSEKYRTAYKGTVVPKRKHVYRAGLRALERLDQIQQELNVESRVLDIGSGGGEFVYLLGKAGYIAQGVEPNLGYAAFSREQYGIDVQDGTLENRRHSSQRWDGITIHHVLEHLTNPVESLKRVHAMLSPDGKLFVEVPNVEARYHGPARQFHFAHLHCFSREGLTDVGSKAGFAVASMSLRPHTAHINAVFIHGNDQPEDGSRQTRAETANRIERNIRSYTPLTDILSLRPYRRFWANAKRPVAEQLALVGLGQPHQAKDILDRLYERRSEQTAIS